MRPSTSTRPTPQGCAPRPSRPVESRSTATTAPTASTGPAGSDWWVPALTPDELVVASSTSTTSTPTRVPSWAASLDGIGRRSAGSGGPSRGASQEGAPREGSPGSAALPAGLARALRPLLADVDQRVRHLHTGAGAAVDPGLAQTVVTDLASRATDLAARTLVVELHRARAAEELRGDTAADRFEDFVDRLGDGAIVPLLRRHPVLARQLVERTAEAVEAHAELVRHLVADRQVIVRELFDGSDPGALVDTSVTGDAHAGGRAVTVLTFASGQRVVHRPRPAELYGHVREIVAWLDRRAGLDLRTLRVVPRSGYGWAEFVARADCPDLSGVRRFYRRQGALLALLHALDATDVHAENLVAVGEHPVVVDLETLFHPVLEVPSQVGPDPAARALRSSVQRTALLPLLTFADDVAVDLSGLGGDDAGRPATLGWVDAGLDTMRLGPVDPPPAALPPHRPRYAGRPADPREHRAALLGGFATAYDAIVAHREELLELVAGCADDEIRVVAQPSSMYAALLAETTHPDLLRSADARDRVLGLVEGQATDPARRRLVPHELAALRRGDVPLFTTTPASRDLRAPDGRTIPDLLERSGLDALHAKVERLGEVDRHVQEWIVTASLEARSASRRTVLHRGPTPRRRVTSPDAAPPAPDPGRLLTAATGIADEILARSFVADGRANWLGVELVDDTDWALLPMGAGLTAGYTGAALFLMQVGMLTGAERYHALAREALLPLPRLLAAMATDPELVEAIGPGLHGLGGIIHGLARGVTLDPGNASLAPALDLALEVALTAPAVAAEDADPSYAEGPAGGLAALHAVADDLPAHRRTALEQLEQRYVTELLEFCSDPAAIVDLGPGFARGRAGIAWSLLRYAAEAPGRDDAERAGLALVDHELSRTLGPRHTDGAPDSVGSGWCSGTSGFALAAHAAHLPTPVTDLLASTGRPEGADDLSLCHGWLGVVETLHERAGAGDTAALRARNRVATDILDLVEVGSPRCGTPGAVPTPGLLAGLAGIGYGLLRLGFPQVPSALLMSGTHPTPPSSRPSPGTAHDSPHATTSSSRSHENV